jgi:ribonuclease P protein component
VLPATARLRHRDDFTRVVRTGRRVGRGALVVHVAGAGIGRGAAVPSRAVVTSPAGVPFADTGRAGSAAGLPVLPYTPALSSDGSPVSGTAAVTGPAVDGQSPAPAPVGLEAGGDASPASGRTPRAGFVVSKAVGPAVTRNLVTRRLRHLVRERLDQLPGGVDLVVRALPAAATRSYEGLAADLDAALTKATARPERVAAIP